MTPIQELRDEHDGIFHMLDIVRAICRKMASRKTIQGEHLDRVMTFLRIFIDRCHHGKEEKIFFPEMKHHPVPSLPDLFDELVKEHGVGRKLMEDMGAALERFYSGNQEAPDIFIEAAERYDALIRGHIQKENTFLFPHAEKELDQDRQAALMERFDQLEEKEIGSGRHDQFHRQMEQLSRIYLN